MQQLRGERLRKLHEIMFSLNIAYALGYALLVWVLRDLTSWVPKTDAGYYFLRAVVRLNDVLHLNSRSAVTTHAAARQHQGRWEQVGEELTIVLSVLGTMFILLLILDLISGRRAHRAIAERFSLVTALFGPPACYLYVSKATWGWTSGLGPQLQVPYTFWQSPLLAVFAGELLCFGTLFLLTHRTRFISVWTLSVLLALHYAFWVVALWTGVPDWRFKLIAPHLLLIVFPLSGVVWLLYFRESKSAAREESPRRVSKWTLSGATASVALLTVLWSPGRAHGVIRSQDLGAATVEISRGPCYGACPSYRVVIQGTGSVEYVGYAHVKIGDRQESVVTSEQLMRILRELDRIDFFNIEDRAFAWCFDTASVEISVSINGKPKRVSGDAFCTGTKFGTQARFVQVANEIDTIVGTGRWVRCDGPCRN